MVARGKDLFHSPVKVKLSRMFNTEIESREVLKFVYNCRYTKYLLQNVLDFQKSKEVFTGLSDELFTFYRRCEKYCCN